MSWPRLCHVVQVRQARDSESTAEWIVDITTLADRQGRALEFADGYRHSQLRQQNEQQLKKCLANASGQVRCRRQQNNHNQKARLHL